MPSGTTRHGHSVSKSSAERGDQLNMPPSSPPMCLGSCGGGSDVSEAAGTDTELVGLTSDGLILSLPLLPRARKAVERHRPFCAMSSGIAGIAGAGRFGAVAGAGQRVTFRLPELLEVQKAMNAERAMTILTRPMTRMAGSNTVLRVTVPLVCKSPRDLVRFKRHQRPPCCAVLSTGASSSETGGLPWLMADFSKSSCLWCLPRLSNLASMSGDGTLAASASSIRSLDNFTLDN
mmetsp:Transcript_33686/g.72682  ORF Transcript_33686/g.72682 Transcript_33686/m.72682 type:complete len:234 (+) Transcript_33686:617-1318(+)